MKELKQIIDRAETSVKYKENAFNPHKYQFEMFSSEEHFKKRLFILLRNIEMKKKCQRVWKILLN